MNTRKKILG